METTKQILDDMLEERELLIQRIHGDDPAIVYGDLDDPEDWKSRIDLAADRAALAALGREIEKARKRVGRARVR